MWRRGTIGGERGQASPEWVALALLVALALAATAAAIGPLPLAASLARAVAGRIVCAVELSRACGRDPELAAAYGDAVARQLRRHAPAVAYERGMKALPVDYRRCRSSSCADASPSGVVWRSDAGEPVTAFVHVVDCRRVSPGALSGPGVSECGGERAGRLYLQYWLYYPDSATLRGVPVAGSAGRHSDDWESYQVRIGRGEDSQTRASSHHGYNHEQGKANWAADAGIGPLRDATEMVGLRSAGGWGQESGWLFVSGGSHAGNAQANAVRYSRMTPRGRLVLVPLEPLAAGEQRGPSFAVSPPWQKAVWSDPEAEGTD